jgi:hypothetical protein
MSATWAFLFPATRTARARCAPIAFEVDAQAVEHNARKVRSSPLRWADSRGRDRTVVLDVGAGDV